VTVFSFAPDIGVLPSKILADSDENWRTLLSEPPVGRKFGSCVRGAVFVEGATAPTALAVRDLHGALFDLDEGAPPTLDELKESFGPRRFVWWTTYNHTPAAPRARLYVPFARSVLPGAYRHVWEQINARFLRSAAPRGQENVDRLGFLPRLKSPGQPYSWCVWGDEDSRLDPYVEFGDGQRLPDGAVSSLEPAYQRVTVEEPDRSRWLSDAMALEEAHARFAAQGPLIEPGSRHLELFKIGCKLWWDFWLDAEGVTEVLRAVNRRMPSPKPDSEVLREVEASFARTRGHSAVAQLDADGNPKAPGCERMRPEALTTEELEALAAVEKKSADFRRREVGRLLSRLVPKNGVVRVFAPVAKRDAALRTCARFLGTRFPNHDPDSMAELFAEALVTTSAQEPWDMTVGRVSEIVAGAQSEARRDAERRRAAEDAARRLRIEQATGGARSTPYTDAEIQAFADDAGCSLAEWNSRWVIAVGPSHYLFVDGDYRAPISKDNVVIAAEESLSPAPVQMFKFARDGSQTLITRAELLRRYGTVADSSVVELNAQRSYYDAKTRVFHEATCPLRTDIEPERVPVVEGWLNSFPDTDARARFFEWLSWATNLDEPLPALYLCGPKGGGKTLLAYALAQLYPARAPTDLGAYFESFNEAITQCPVLFADEHLPPQLRSRKGTDIFRQMVLAQKKALKRKYLNTSVITGHFRVILAANNDRLLPRGSEVVTDDDSAAIADRLIFLDMGPGPSAYLNSLPPSKRDAFKSQNLLAKHVLWMRNNRPARGAGRSPVEGSSSRATKRIDYAGVRGELLQWLFVVLVEGADDFMAFRDEKPVAVFRDRRTGDLHAGVRSTLVASSWKAIIGTDKSETLAEITEALNSVKIEKKRVRAAKGSRAHHYFIVDTRHLVSWAEFMGLATAEEISEALVEQAGTGKVKEFESSTLRLVV